MNNELVKIDFTNEQVNLIKTQIAPKANDNELKLFLYQARRTGLDPLARQIYAIHRWNSQQGKEVMTIQTSIDGFRVIAERSGDYGGQDEPIFEDDHPFPIKCKITVYRFRHDIRYPAAVGIAYWDEYVQTDKNGNPSGLWKKMPHVMLAKVAEALALRKAYPQDLSGLYTSEEMQESDVVKEDTATYQEVEPVHEMVIPIGDIERDELMELLEKSTYEGKVKDKLFSKINSLSTREEYDKAKANLIANQAGIDGAINPSQSEINKHIRKIAQPA